MNERNWAEATEEEITEHAETLGDAGLVFNQEVLDFALELARRYLARGEEIRRLKEEGAAMVEDICHKSGIIEGQELTLRNLAKRLREMADEIDARKFSDIEGVLMLPANLKVGDEVFANLKVGDEVFMGDKKGKVVSTDARVRTNYGEFDDQIAVEGIDEKTD